mgnify:FL=1
MRTQTWLYPSALAAGEVVVSPWVRTASAVDVANDLTETRREERFDKQYFSGLILNPVGSAASGLVFQYSEDEATVSWSDTAQTVTGSATVPFTFRIPMSYGMWIRLSYTHGAVAVAANLHEMRAFFEEDV